MKVDRNAPRADDSGRSQAPENGISRRDTLTLGAAGVAVRLLPTNSFAHPSRRQDERHEYVEGQGGASHGLTWTRAEEVNAS